MSMDKTNKESKILNQIIRENQYLDEQRSLLIKISNELLHTKIRPWTIFKIFRLIKKINYLAVNLNSQILHEIVESKLSTFYLTDALESLQRQILILNSKIEERE